MSSDTSRSGFYWAESLEDALDRKFEQFYREQCKVSFDRCDFGYIIDAEGPQNALTYKDGLGWHQAHVIRSTIWAWNMVEWNSHWWRPTLNYAKNIFDKRNTSIHSSSQTKRHLYRCNRNRVYKITGCRNRSSCTDQSIKEEKGNYPTKS
jgi:hypothetical protein